MENEPTLGEIMRRLDEMSLELKAIPLRFDETYVRREVARADHERIIQALNFLTTRLEKIESRSEWTIRTVGALIFGAVFAAALIIA